MNKNNMNKIKSDMKDKKEFISSIKKNLPQILISAFAVICLLAANFDILFIAIIIIAIFFLYGIFNK